MRPAIVTINHRSWADAAEEDPYTDANGDCSITVKFKGNLSKGTPKFATRPNRAQLGEYTGTFYPGKGEKWTSYEFRFEVTGSVAQGRIGQIGDPKHKDSTRLGSGKWQIGQWKFPFPSTNVDGAVNKDIVGKTTDDSPKYPKGPFFRGAWATAGGLCTRSHGLSGHSETVRRFAARE
jgi:hypothetical protein